MPNRLTPLARALRKDATSAERRLWSGLRREQIGFKFRRQVILAGFIVDFACYEARLVIEVDGATHSTADKIARDAKRSEALHSEGYTILRFTNEDVYRHLDGVVEMVRLKLAELRPRLCEANSDERRDPPPPQGGRESSSTKPLATG